MKKIFSLTLLLMSVVLTAQETEETEEKSFSLSGSVDAYYQTYLSAPDDAGASFGTAFANQTGFAIGMGNIIASYENGKVGAVLDLVTGPRGAGATFSNDIVDGIVNQAYVYYNISENTTLTMGRFNTFLGYEVIAPAANFNYSTSYLFSSGPFSHVGLKADFALSEDFSLMLAVMNPWDTNDTSFTGEYSFGAQLGYSGQYLNLYYDSGNNGGLGFEIDYTGGFDLSDSFFLGINAAYNDNDGSGFYGAALYPQLATSDEFSIGLRGEYFALHGDANNDESVLGLTLTGSYSVDSNLIIKPEFRLDSLTDADGGIYGNVIDNDGAAASSLSAFTVAAIYSF
ncbi:outer membrane beta-barrel protein [Winogradskyella endarachnes]|uniref:Outer membrane beta-barrel protein n=1 Tax=Winogradskyella endarachnes TaxID=2681965 RepID=A0A6L6U9W6_9FLAO|nr:outer membrane beta-barrel protein [Winogradskyella endarachnes]MUU78809.1 outer membrane beta-barrel protein [Winogradskyella endarachnes]